MTILQKIANLAVTLTGLADDKVLIARENYLNLNFNDDLIVIDLLEATPIARENDYDGSDNVEQMTYRVYYKSQITIDFFGTNSLTNASIFIAKLKSQICYEFKRDNSIEVFLNKTLTNVKDLQGETTYERYQLEIVVKYTEEFVEEVLRIDTADYEIYFNE